MKTVTKQTYTLFWNHAKRQWRLGVFVLLGVTIAVTTAVIVPLYYKKIFDVLAAPAGMDTNSQVAEMIRLLLSIVGLHMVGWLGWRLSTFSNNRFVPTLATQVAETCFEYLHKHSYGFFTNRFVGAVVRKVNRLVDAYEGMTERIFWDLFPLALRTVLIVGIIFYYSAVIGSVLLGWAILYLVINYYFALYKLRYDVQRAAVDSETTAQLADTITNNTNIKVFTSLKDELRWFRELLNRQRRLRVFTWDLESYMFALQDVLMLAVEFAVFYVAIYAWAEGRLTIGTLVLIQAYLFQAFVHLWDFGRVVRAMYRHLADAEEMVETLHTPHEIQDKPKARKLTVKAGQVEFRDVSFTYSRTREVIKRLDLTIAPKEKVGLVGPSGAGKSTIVALIFRFFDVASGGIYIDGTNIADVTQESLRSQLSLVPQDPVLFHRTLFENIRYGRRTATNKEVLEAARLAHCDDFIARLPDGYNTYVGERGIKLSGGERQRVAIARAILKDAPILVLDEATSSLDSHSEAMIQDALKTLMRGKTTIVIAHRLSTIMNMDRIVVIGDGRVRETGTHRRLLENSGGLYKQLWELQAGGFIADRAGAGK